jgi:hypothetical protein
VTISLQCRASGVAGTTSRGRREPAGAAVGKPPASRDTGPSRVDKAFRKEGPRRRRDSFSRVERACSRHRGNPAGDRANGRCERVSLAADRMHAIFHRDVFGSRVARPAGGGFHEEEGGWDGRRVILGKGSGRGETPCVRLEVVGRFARSGADA